MTPESLIKAVTFVRMTSNQEVVFLEICVALVIVIEKKNGNLFTHGAPRSS